MTFQAKLALCAAAVVLGSGAAMAEGWQFEIYGGATAERSEVYDGTSYDMDSGGVLGLGIYRDGLLPGLTLGLDLMGTRALYTGYPGEYIETLSLMAVLRKDFALGQRLEGYVAGGLGAIENTYDDGDTDYSQVVPGAQLSLGLRQAVGGSTSLFGEIKHQVGLEDADVDGVDQSYSSTSLLFGVQFGF